MQATFAHVVGNQYPGGETNNKAVYLVRDGVKQEINEYLDEDSDFIQLQHGTNTIRYTADAGEDYLNVTVSYRFRYLGV